MYLAGEGKEIHLAGQREGIHLAEKREEIRLAGNPSADLTGCRVALEASRNIDVRVYTPMQRVGLLRAPGRWATLSPRKASASRLRRTCTHEETCLAKPCCASCLTGRPSAEGKGGVRMSQRYIQSSQRGRKRFDSQSCWSSWFTSDNVEGNHSILTTLKHSVHSLHVEANLQFFQISLESEGQV